MVCSFHWVNIILYFDTSSNDIPVTKISTPFTVKQRDHSD
jgi:hypothetical protein